MSAPFPEIVDAWRMVTARRSFNGTLAVAGLPRLCEAVAAPEGTVTYDVEFGRDELGTAYIAVRAQTSLVMLCQRTLENFLLPVTIDARLGLIVREEEEAGLSPGYEPLLLESSEIKPADVIEDELLLALPLIALRPDLDESEVIWSTGPDIEPEPERANPFALLDRLKK